MSISLSWHSLRQWVKHDPHPVAKKLFFLAQTLRNLDLPAPRLFYLPALFLFQNITNLLRTLLRLLWWTPLFKMKTETVGDGLYLYGGMPYTAGPLKIEIGHQCRISGKTTLTGRTHSSTPPRIIFGNNIDLGWMTTVAVGSRVVLEDNVRIAAQCFLAGYPGHPMDAHDRARGLPETDAQVGDIVLRKDVWLGTGVSVMAGVTIGEGTVVGAASVVTRDLPAYVLAAGNPARVIRPLQASDNQVNTGCDANA